MALSPGAHLLIAACAELAGLAALHYDADFERIAKLTDNPRDGSCRWRRLL